MPVSEKLINNNLELLTSAIKEKSLKGRGSSKKDDLYGIEKLRQFILKLAVRGMLIPQDLKDDSANELIKKGLIEKSNLIKEGKIKREKALKPIKREDFPFAIPETWCWVRLSEVSFFQEGPGILAKDFRKKGVPLIRISGMHGESVSLDGCNYLDRNMVEDKWSHFKLDEGDVVLSSSASLGKVAEVTKETIGCIVYTGLIRFKRYSSLLKGYLIKFLESSEFVRQINKSKTGSAIKHFGPTHLKGMMIPVPPLAEQQRIVTKINYLMEICDQLELKHKENLETHETMVSTLLSGLTSVSPKNSQFEEYWKLIQDNFDILFTTESSIEQMKLTIYQLAVMGKLAKQDPSDASASVLLREIITEKEKLNAEKKVNKIKPVLPVSEDEVPLKIPNGWSWTRFQALPTSYNVGLDRGKSLQGPNRAYRYFKMNNILNNGGFNLSEITSVDASNEEVEKFKLKSGELLFNTRNSKELVGKTCVFEEDGHGIVLYNNNILRAHFSTKIIAHFLDIWMRSPSGRLELEKLKSGTTNVWAIYQGKLETLACPIPPKEEQIRIVAKVNELIDLCDQLKASLVSAQDNQLKLADILVEETFS